MLGFILSKFNLLIFATAIFAIVTFFMFSLSDLSEVKEARELVFKMRESAFALASSPSYCASDSVVIPNELRVSGVPLYYVIKISKSIITDDEGKESTVVIFSVYPRKELEKAQDDSSYTPNSIAAENFRTKGDVSLYSLPLEGDNYSGSMEKAEEVYIDPQAINPRNTIEMIKEVEGGKTKLYLIICNTEYLDNLCESYKTQVGEEMVHPPVPPADAGGFNC